MYRPNFCAECGTGIVRLRWRIWTSRRFCDECVKRSWKQRATPALVAGLLLLVIGVVVGSSLRSPPPPLIIQRPENPTSDARSGDTDRSRADPKQTATSEVVYICGARTKKGTPCSRRVHGPVRCWQHKGLPAMLPEDKLMIKD